MSTKKKPVTKAGKQAKVGKVMHEFGKGGLHSGSKSGPIVTNAKQAIAIGMRQAGMPMPGKPKGRR